MPTRMNRTFLAAIALNGAVLCGCGGDGDSNGAPPAGTANAPSGQPTDGNLQATGFRSDYFGFGVGFQDTWKPVQGQLDFEGALVWGSGHMCGSGTYQSNDLPAMDLYHILLLERAGSTFCVHTRSQQSFDGAQLNSDAELLADTSAPGELVNAWTETSPVSSVTVGGRPVARRSGTFSCAGKAYPVTQLGFLSNGYGVIITTSAASTADATELESILGTIQFD